MRKFGMWVVLAVLPGCCLGVSDPNAFIGARTIMFRDETSTMLQKIAGTNRLTKVFKDGFRARGYSVCEPTDGCEPALYAKFEVDEYGVKDGKSQIRYSLSIYDKTGDRIYHCLSDDAAVMPLDQYARARMEQALQEIPRQVK